MITAGNLEVWIVYFWSQGSEEGKFIFSQHKKNYLIIKAIDSPNPMCWWVCVCVCVFNLRYMWTWDRIGLHIYMLTEPLCFLLPSHGDTSCCVEEENKQLLLKKKNPIENTSKSFNTLFSSWNSYKNSPLGLVDENSLRKSIPAVCLTRNLYIFMKIWTDLSLDIYSNYFFFIFLIKF